eukprot:3867452-Pyramimonas_sp.AAC.2
MSEASVLTAGSTAGLLVHTNSLQNCSARPIGSALIAACTTSLWERAFCDGREDDIKARRSRSLGRGRPHTWRVCLEAFDERPWLETEKT